MNEEIIGPEVVEELVSEFSNAIRSTLQEERDKLNHAYSQLDEKRALKITASAAIKPTEDGIEVVTNVAFNADRVSHKRVETIATKQGALDFNKEGHEEEGPE